jgi:hypothetical protein
MTSAAVASFVVLLPFVALEMMNQPLINFPIVLFVVMWLMQFALLSALVSIVRRVRGGGSNWIRPAMLLVRVAFVVAVAILWGGLVADQMPCFLGVPNCD